MKYAYVVDAFPENLANELDDIFETTNPYDSFVVFKSL